MPISPWPSGQTFPPGQFTLTVDGGKPLPINYTPAPTFVLLIRNLITLEEVTGTSVITISDPINSVVNVAWTSADTGQSPSNYEMRVKVTYNGGGATGTATSDPQPWTITVP